MPPSAEARAVSLTKLRQSELETAWLVRLTTLTACCPAAALYAGRGFHLARRAAETAGAPLYIISAGLGLVVGDRPVPAYGVTVSGRGPDAIALRAVGRFDPVSWWRAVSRGPFATPLTDMLGATSSTSGPVLVALTHPYARMVASVLEELPDDKLAHLRIIGLKLDNVLPGRLQRAVLPYDERFDSMMPGTRSDFPQRALLHFVTKGLAAYPSADANYHRDWVRSTLAPHDAPSRPNRARVSDEGITDLIERHLPTTRCVGRLLRTLRDEEGIACEQARFTRLYRAALARAVA
jgi:hypothetical protein